MPDLPEGLLISRILNEFGSRPELRLWRANVLVARTNQGRIVRAGIKGQADISGIWAPTGRRIEIECKTSTGKQREEQMKWQRMIEAMGGVYILARSVADVGEVLGV